MKKSSNPDLLPPHAEEAERGALGCILLSPDTALADLQEQPDPIGLFYDTRHRKLAEVAIDLSNAGRPVDMITIPQRLSESSALDEAGGLAYLTGHVDVTPSAANLGYYLSILSDYRKRRQLIAACTRIEEAARGPDINSALALAEREVFSIGAGTTDENGGSIKEGVLGWIDSIESACKNRGKPLGLSTGLIDLDKLIRGMRPGQLIVVGARPSEGKSALAAQIGARNAVDDQLPVAIWSLEMQIKEIAGRIVAARAHVPVTCAEEGELKEQDMKRLTVAAGAVAKAPLHIYDRGGITITTLRSMARRSARKYGLKLIIVDYCGLIHGSERRKERRDLEIGEITSGLKELAKELQLPIVLLSQLNRDYDRERNREPRLSDLRDSGSIEQDADIVIMIHPELPKDGEELPDRQPAKLLVKKNRNGRTGPVHVIFNRPLMRFESATR